MATLSTNEGVMTLGPHMWPAASPGRLAPLITPSFFVFAVALALVVMRGTAAGEMPPFALVGLVTLAGLCVAAPSALMPMTPIWLRVDRRAATIELVSFGWLGWSRQTIAFDAIASVESISTQTVGIIDNQGRVIALPSSVTPEELATMRALIGCTPWQQ